MNRLFMLATQNLPFFNMSRFSSSQKTCASQIILTLLSSNLHHSSFDIGSGSTIAPDGTMRFPGDLILHGSTVNPLIHCIYPDLLSIPPPHPQSLMDYVILAP